MLEIKNLNISIKDRLLVKDLSFNLNKNDKLAIIGEEGNGKSTLLKAIINKCEYASVTGIINTKGRIGYLKQSMDSELNSKVYDYLFIDENDYYNKINNLYKCLDRLNITDELLNRKINTLSGGEKVKIGILKLLLDENEILLLDEPTNDLDISSLEWLESFINNETRPIIFVSHDETLLSNTANIILHIEQLKHKKECKYTLVRSNYEEYVNKRLRMLEHLTMVANNERREYKKKEEKLKRIINRVEYEQDTISRSDPHGGRLLKKKMKNLKSQERKLDNYEFTDIPDPEEAINIFFENVNIPKNKIILKFNKDKLTIGNKVLSNNINLEVIGNKHIGIIGNNGVGKTTLLKEIYYTLRDREDLKVGYMPQDYDELLSNYEKVLDYICDNKNKDDITKSRMYLGNMKFTKEEMEGKIYNLSNGSKAKLILMKLVLDKCNVLLLDEPTRNLSPLSNPIIRKVLNNFNGTIISISHDRKYLSEVINEKYLLTKDGLIKVD